MSFASAQFKPPVETFDVIIVSESSGGIGAAIGAARLGASVALIEDSPVLGGMLTNGISNIDAFSYESLSGVFEEFRQAVKNHYAPIMDTDPVYAKKMSDKLKERNFNAPKNVDGLLVPVALSATHVAFSAIRMDPTWTVVGQSAGIAAVLSIRNNVQVRDVDVTELQAELLKKKCKLVFYRDVPTDHPQFEIIQKLSLEKSITGDFHPDSLLTRAYATILLSRLFELNPSISNAHFKDVPYTHTAFREIETLFDNGALTALGVNSGWKEQNGYDAKKLSGFKQDYGMWNFYPDMLVSGNEFQQMVQILRNGGALSTQDQITEATDDPPSLPQNNITIAKALSYFNRVSNYRLK